VMSIKAVGIAIKLTVLCLFCVLAGALELVTECKNRCLKVAVASSADRVTLFFISVLGYVALQASISVTDSVRTEVSKLLLPPAHIHISSCNPPTAFTNRSSIYVTSDLIKIWETGTLVEGLGCHDDA
ncbi:hypothetical protein HID58_080036, partial [Brassica napus]